MSRPSLFELSRRSCLVALPGLVACAPAVRRGAAPSDATGSIRVVNTMPIFFSYWKRAATMGLPEQVAAFRREVQGRLPSLYTPSVMGLPIQGADAERERRLALWLPSVPRILPAMQKLSATFESEVSEALLRFRRALPSFHFQGDCYAFASVDSMNGALRVVDDKPALLFGLDVIAKNTGSMPLAVLFSHELFHAHHERLQPSTAKNSTLLDALWLEGLATLASIELNPGSSDREALPMSHLHDPDNPALDIPERRVWLSEIMPTHAKTLGPLLLSVLDLGERGPYETFFLGRANQALGQRPVRSAYWFGLQVARKLAARRSLVELAEAAIPSLRSEVRAALREVIAGPR